jgi:hypothetical protein
LRCSRHAAPGGGAMVELRRRRMRLNFGVRLSCASTGSIHNANLQLRHLHRLLLLLPCGWRPASRRCHRSGLQREPRPALRRTLLLHPLVRRPPSGRQVSPPPSYRRAGADTLLRRSDNRAYGRAQPASSRARRSSPTANLSLVRLLTSPPSLRGRYPSAGQRQSRVRCGEPLLPIGPEQERERSGPDVDPVAPPATTRHLQRNSARVRLLRCLFERAESAICLCRKA